MIDKLLALLSLLIFSSIFLLNPLIFDPQIKQTLQSTTLYGVIFALVITGIAPPPKRIISLIKENKIFALGSLCLTICHLISIWLSPFTLGFGFTIYMVLFLFVFSLNTSSIIYAKNTLKIALLFTLCYMAYALAVGIHPNFTLFSTSQNGLTIYLFRLFFGVVLLSSLCNASSKWRNLSSNISLVTVTAITGFSIWALGRSSMAVAVTFFFAYIFFLSPKQDFYKKVLSTLIVMSFFVVPLDYSQVDSYGLTQREVYFRKPGSIKYDPFEALEPKSQKNQL